jgi:hypothetical protein
MPNRGHEGTGKHPHKSASEKSSSGRTQQAGGRESSDLKSREYRGADGQIHHHTKTYERDHPGKSR